MNLTNRIGDWVRRFLTTKAEEEFDVVPMDSEKMDRFMSDCADIYNGNPAWIADDTVKTINFAKTICEEIARLTTLAIGIHLDGGARAEYLQKIVDRCFNDLRKWVEYASAFGTIIIKPNISGIECIFHDEFMITDMQNGEVTGAVFIDHDVSKDGKLYFKKLEYHRYEGSRYIVENKCYVSKTKGGKEEPIDIENTPWAGLQEMVEIGGMTGMMFAVFTMPNANNVDNGSSLGLPIFSGAVEELYDLDVAYTRFTDETYDSKRTVLLDSDRLLPTGTRVYGHGSAFERTKKSMGLPRFVKMIFGNGDDVYHEINPVLQTEDRIKAMNALLSMIAYKVGFSQGYFSFDAQNGIQTATGVEANERRTIQLIKDIRDQFQGTIDNLLHAVDVLADLYGLAPIGTYKVNYEFGDITYNYEEDKARWYSYVVSGKMAFWRYLVKFENMSEKEAKEIEEEGKSAYDAPSLFGEE